LYRLNKMWSNCSSPFEFQVPHPEVFIAGTERSKTTNCIIFVK
jgi:hypothetical protein